VAMDYGQLTPQQAFFLSLVGAGQFAGKPGSQLNTGDLSTLFSPDLGLLTGTLTDTTTQSDDDLYASFAPNIWRVKSNPEIDPIATGIVQDLEAGVSLPKVLIELRKKASGEDLKAYKDYAKTVSEEMGEVKVQMGKRQTPAAKAGLPEPGAPFDPTPFMGDIYESLTKQIQPSTAPKVYEKKPFSIWKDAPKEFFTNPLKLLRRIPYVNPKMTRNEHAAEEKKQAFLDKQYEDANKARVKIANQQRMDVENLLAARMQQDSLAGSPFMDELLKRAILKRLIENPGAINKLINRQG